MSEDPRELISRRAFEIYQTRGASPDGSQFADWIQAEREVLAELSANVGLDAAPEAADERPVKKRRAGVKRAPRQTTGKTSEA